MLHVLVLIAALSGAALAPWQAAARARLPPASARPAAAIPLPTSSPGVPGRRWRDISPGGPI